MVSLLPTAKNTLLPSSLKIPAVNNQDWNCHLNVLQNLKYSIISDVKNKLTVFMTDYSNYAGLYSCNKWFFSYINEAIILSRTPTLYKVYLEQVCFYDLSFALLLWFFYIIYFKFQVRSRLSKIDVSPNTVSQRNCPNRGCHGHFRYC